MDESELTTTSLAGTGIPLNVTESTAPTVPPLNVYAKLLPATLTGVPAEPLGCRAGGRRRRASKADLEVGPQAPDVRRVVVDGETIAVHAQDLVDEIHVRTEVENVEGRLSPVDQGPGDGHFRVRIPQRSR